MNPHTRIRLDVQGRVQGVGFRPFAFRLARELGLSGWVRNSRGGACVEVEGPPDAVQAYARRLSVELPEPGAVWKTELSPLAPLGDADMRIVTSDQAGPASAAVLPDLALCSDCRRELFDPKDRRHLYPFINCTHCGPRFSIALGRPYDRERTTMRDFAMCPACRAEYEHPADRRFHAQAIACPDCGPALALWDAAGRPLTRGNDALHGAVQAIRRGEIVALKGLGGFQLIVDARNAEAVAQLRERKHRPAKPFALMFGSLASLHEHCAVTSLEETLLTSAAAPIVLLRRHGASDLAENVAPENPLLGAMLPYTPLHALMMNGLDGPIAATSGNLSGEPICTDEREAIQRLRGIADCFLLHDRPVARPLDDSVARVMGGQAMVLRCARGYAPLALEFSRPAGAPALLALGGHLKSAIAFSTADGMVLGQHLGDLDSSEAAHCFERAIDDTERLFDVAPRAIVHDPHPGYHSTRTAQGLGRPTQAVQHHHAHVIACAVDNGIQGPVLGVAWDGTGLGSDGTSWGGEVLRVEGASCERVAHLLPFQLPGGDVAAREPRRAALGVLAAVLGEEAFSRRDLAPVASFHESELRVLRTATERGVNAPLTSSAGRLFDAVAALLGLVQRISFEAQAAMALEFTAERARGETRPYPIAVDAGGVIDWRVTIHAVLADLDRRAAIETIAARFHIALIEAIGQVAERFPALPVLLTGGCFQNRVLLEGAAARLRSAGLRPYWHRRVPPNDGGLAVGQLAAAAAWIDGGGPCA